MKEWKGLKSFGMVHKKLARRDGSQEEEWRCYICSIGEDAAEFERAARGHQGVEDRLHWQLDFTFRDDKNTSMAKAGAKYFYAAPEMVLRCITAYKFNLRLTKQVW